ncbi:hypothetical protein Dvina_43305 [Dactylosporangium vinaceum]|uniref:Uncharacterized protein n=1 Tax=Dactylosporangium vinaceum TaxID=53362 RepID=A0ABV5MH72_9ACTN|nr:hypothetical protein [Dactylosporangium vinaceum]UAB94852.1 hypothetical protein Dvina_43305 [Dactylosporangium vinaceum]
MAARMGTFFLVIVAVLLLATPAQAHGGAAVTINSDGRGSVWITAHWQDGHPINEPTQVTMAARTDAGAAVPPATLHQTGDERGTQTYTGTLDPGAWRISIDLGAPVNGHCQALIPVAPSSATAQPTEVACLIPATAQSAAATDGAAGSLTPLWITLAALAVAGAAVATYRFRRRPRGETPAG